MAREPLPPEKKHPLRRIRVGDGPVARSVLLGAVLVVTLLVLVAPLVAIFAEAFRHGAAAYAASFAAPDTQYAIGLTLFTALIVVPINVGFGIAAAWCIAKFRFPGRNLLVALVELPFSISPIIAGVAYLFVYGAQGLFGPWLEAHDIKIMFAVPAIILASLFVTAPFVARELIPLMIAQGSEEEEAAVTLGAGGWRILRLVTLPNVRFALLYGAALCNARVMGEFGAVSVVSGNIRGQTNTLPLQIELLYQDNNAIAAFAVATLLTAVALVTLIAKTIIERLDAAREKTAGRAGH
ncbi:sulfate ABC transporter, inner membrane subunit CysW [Ancylobacter novellus DSM 506]|uniref:Sulfate ABC transporter, inner membrane subunit CysW n=1 Tax=Ancylobacter novellus (strain ATCC 8093 / DSM 506 / JCM 20403 / CCM 1077 / IAM 12100 / NBRC 12443 / NCIMB 10456) TaxID=639283 RepID=D6ZZK4_ANCN5|nr:sulfate ABC transporter permease subunit CysW [Ancylobacter novellus]ADH91199.1 sulfate ABC transporter, inner membrane subunit CysW [Ancylobacter novellus DSM 506]